MRRASARCRKPALTGPSARSWAAGWAMPSSACTASKDEHTPETLLTEAGPVKCLKGALLTADSLYGDCCRVLHNPSSGQNCWDDQGRLALLLSFCGFVLAWASVYFLWHLAHLENTPRLLMLTYVLVAFGSHSIEGEHRQKVGLYLSSSSIRPLSGFRYEIVIVIPKHTIRLASSCSC